MKIFNKIKLIGAAAAVSSAIFAGSALTAYAAIPTLSITTVNSNQVQVIVQNADLNASVNLYYYQSNYGSATYAGMIGSTNSSGYLSTTLAQNSYGIPSGANAYVLVNGQQSNSAAWPYGFNNNGGNYGSGTITFSQPNVTVSQGAIQYVTVFQNGSNYSGSAYVISSNSNPGVVSAITGGNLVSLSGISAGSATVTVCPAGGAYNYNYNAGCGTLYVTVTPNYYGTNYGYENPNYYYAQPQPSSVYLSRVPYTGVGDWGMEAFVALLVSVSGFGAYRLARRQKAA